MWRNAYTKAVTWFLFSVVLSVGVPIVVMTLLACCFEKPVDDSIFLYLGPSGAPITAFALLMAATGDRIIERWSPACILGWVGAIDVVAMLCLAAPLYLHFFDAHGHPSRSMIVLTALPMLALAVVATGIKFEDWRKHESDARISLAARPGAGH